MCTVLVWTVHYGRGDRCIAAKALTDISRHTPVIQGNALQNWQHIYQLSRTWYSKMQYYILFCLIIIIKSEVWTTLFRARSWNNGMRCMSLYILTHTYVHVCRYLFSTVVCYVYLCLFVYTCTSACSCVYLAVLTYCLATCLFPTCWFFPICIPIE